MSKPQTKRTRHAPLCKKKRKKIIKLHHQGYGTRRIADRIPCPRKRVQEVLRKAGLLGTLPSRPKKLTGFEEVIEDKVKQKLTTSRILREIKELGYTGGRTILAELVRALRAKHAIQINRKKTTRRFETLPGEEMQIDWSPYVVEIAGQMVAVKAFGCLLCASRKLFIYFFEDERQTMLLVGLTCSLFLKKKWSVNSAVGRATESQDILNA